MNKDYEYLQRVSTIVEGYNKDNQSNKSLENRSAAILKKAKDDISAKHTELDKKINKRSSSLATRDGGFLILLFLVAAVAVLLIGPFSFFKPAMSFSVEDYVSECADEVRSGSWIAKLYFGDDFDKILEEENKQGGISWIPGLEAVGGEKKMLETDREFVQKCATLLYGNIIFMFALCAIIGFILSSVAVNLMESVGNFSVAISGILLVGALVVVIFFFEPQFEKIARINATEMFFGGLLQIILGIPLLFVTSGKMLWPILLIHIGIHGSMILYAFILKRNRDYFVSERTDSVINGLLDEKVSFAKAKNAKAKQDSDAVLAKRAKSKYTSAYLDLPNYLKDINTVHNLMAAIRNGYADSIVSARNYLDRKAHEAKMQKGMQQAVNDAKAARKAAEDAKYAAENTTVEVTYYYR